MIPCSRNMARLRFEEFVAIEIIEEIKSMIDTFPQVILQVQLHLRIYPYKIAVMIMETLATISWTQ